MTGFDSKQRMAADKLQEIFCGVDYANGVLAVSVMRRSPDGVAELLHSEQIELAQPAQEPVAHVYLFDHDGRPRVAWDNAKGVQIGDKLYTAPPQREQNFCERCGKRTKDMTTIHTCTPPQ